MTTVTESDIKELKELIMAQTERLNAISKDIAELSKNVTELSKDVTDLRISHGKIKATLQSQQPLIPKIPDLIEKVGELKNWKQISLVVVTAFISSILSGTIGGVIGWLIRIGRNYPNP